MKYTATQKKENELRVCKASQPYILQSAYQNIGKANRDRFLASAVTITVKSINILDNTIVEEFIINGGLSDETIKAIKIDIQNSYKYLVELPNSIILKD